MSSVHYIAFLKLNSHSQEVLQFNWQIWLEQKNHLFLRTGRLRQVWKPSFEFCGIIATTFNSNIFPRNVIFFLPRYLISRHTNSRDITILVGRIAPFSEWSCFWSHAVMMTMRTVLLIIIFMISSYTGQFLQCHVMFSIILSGSLKLAINPDKMSI